MKHSLIQEGKLQLHYHLTIDRVICRNVEALQAHQEERDQSGQETCSRVKLKLFEKEYACLFLDFTLFI